MKTITNQVNQRERITSIKQGASFMGCSEPTFQRLKLSGKVRVYQYGRKFIIYVDELLEDLQNPKKPMEGK